MILLPGVQSNMRLNPTNPQIKKSKFSENDLIFCGSAVLLVMNATVATAAVSNLAACQLQFGILEKHKTCFAVKLTLQEGEADNVSCISPALTLLFYI